MRHLGQHGEWTGHGLLAHAAVANTGLDRFGIERKADGAALAATGVTGRGARLRL
jgi:hypothetical protein